MSSVLSTTAPRGRAPGTDSPRTSPALACQIVPPVAAHTLLYRIATPAPARVRRANPGASARPGSPQDDRAGIQAAHARSRSEAATDVPDGTTYCPLFSSHSAGLASA
ncbi:hypothetical protein GCM10010259_65410 [Streptomyces daghestanicus]|uniref:Uncharacterized protein n=1 Tax=Streptomyces daghestanicus TaxID=66885 RepID=A0ABQ3PWN3_9ACTN|nr:hypothetical protein GCM10010259_65410 [Streptomyces daghestanicus]GHI29421.1 hypothetical protein Sdagh_11510 [Streptomyces daghestanicus]